MAADDKKTSPRPQDYEKLGRAVEGAMINDYIDLLGNTRKQIWSAFIRGIFAGFGSVVGATAVVALVIFILHQLGGLPIIGHYLQNAGNTIQK